MVIRGVKFLPTFSYLCRLVNFFFVLFGVTSPVSTLSSIFNIGWIPMEHKSKYGIIMITLLIILLSIVHIENQIIIEY